MPVRKKKSAYTLYSLVRTLFDEVALAALGLWLLPRLGVSIPVWFVAAFMVAWAVYSLLTSRLVAKVVDRAAAVGAETLIGVKCTTITPLSPYGYVRVGSELWRACAIAGDIYAGAEVVIEGINGLTLLVKPSMEVSFDEAAHTSSETGMSCAQNKGSSQCSVLQMSLQSLSFRT